ncbi:MAG TPA: NUDIX domain-containing protein, partial [Candidatus Saccharimonadales bacterium]
MQADLVNTKEYVQKLVAVSDKVTPVRIIDVPVDQRRTPGWKIMVNGESWDAVSSAHLTQEQMGIEVSYGLHPQGYDGVIIREFGGGGAVTIPYMIHPETGHIYVGLVKEHRPLVGGEVWNVPRGFVNFGETHQHSAEREVTEEMGYASGSDRIIKLAE